MKRRSETAEIPKMVNDFRVWHRRLTSQYVEATNAEIVHHFGYLRSLATALHE